MARANLIQTLDIKETLAENGQSSIFSRTNLFLYSATTKRASERTIEAKSAH